MIAHRDEEDRTGLPSSTTIRKTCGRVISDRSQTSSFAHCLLSSSSRCTLGESFMWGSTHLHDLLPMPGLPVPLREATAYGAGPKYLMRDRESKFGTCARS